MTTMIKVERVLDGRTFRGQVCAQIDPKHGPVLAPDVLLLFEQKVAQLAATQGVHGPQSFRFLRKVADINIQELARLLRVERTTIYRWEKGESDIPGGVMETVRALALEATSGNGTDTMDRLNAALTKQPRMVELPPLEEAS
jgi:DNA-binding XRE family transcriptional regulator